MKTAGTRLDKMTKDLMVKDNISYSDAFLKVSEQNRELAEIYTFEVRFLGRNFDEGNIHDWQEYLFFVDEQVKNLAQKKASTGYCNFNEARNIVENENLELKELLSEIRHGMIFSPKKKR